MAKYTAQYTFGVSADTKNAQGSLSSLTKSLRSLQSAKYTLQIDDQSVKKAAESAATLQTALRNAVNVDTGKINLSKFNSELQSAGTSLQKLSQTLINSGQQGQQAFTQLANSIAQAEMPVRSLNKVFAQMGTTLMNTIKWQAASSLIHGLMSNISGAISYAKNLNSTLNDIQIVTGASSDQMARFAASANEAAKRLSTSTNEFAKASLIYYQQGDSAALAAKKAEITTKAANVAFTASAQEMSQMLTAVWNSFQMGEDQLEHAVDVMAKLGANTASSMEEMARAMQKVAATANTVGVSMDQMSAIVATAASVTRQAPETIGTAWNTVLGRISNLKLGETLEDGVDLTKYTKALQSIGVNVLDATGELRDMGTVIEEIGAKWQTLDKAQKSALAATIGGVRQYTQINAFFENFDKYQKNLKDYTGSNATGELNKQQETYAQSWEAASKRVKASMETVYSQLIDDKAITKLTSLLADLINLGTSLTGAFGGMGNVISLVVTQLAQANIEKLSTKIQEAGTSIKQLFTGDSGQINQYKQSIQETIDMLNSVSNNNNTSSSMSTEIQFDVEILKMKEQLIEKEGKLTEAQKATANQIIENMQANKSYYVEMMKGQEEARKSIEETKKAITEQMKERIAESTDPNLYADNKKTSYAQHQKDLRIANHMVMDIMPEETRNRVYDVLQAMGQIKNVSDDVTVGKLIHSLQQAAEEAGRYTAIMNEGQRAFGDSKGNWNATQYQGTDQDRFTAIQSMAQLAANSKDQGVSDAGNQVLTNLQTIDPSNVTELNSQLAILKESLGQAETSAGDAMDTLKEGAEAAGQNVDDLVNKSLKIGGNLDQMADDAKTAMERFKATFANALESNNKKVQKFAQGAIALQRVATAFSAIGNAVNKMKDPNVGVWEKLTTVLGACVSVGFALSSVMTYIKANQDGILASTIKEIGAHYAGAVATGAHSAAYGVLSTAVFTAKKMIDLFMDSNPIGWILRLIAVIIALVSIIGAIDSGNKKWGENLANRSKDLAESMEETGSAANKLQTDLSNLQDIMHDTGLTYEEQLTKINEICAAYGVQATMLDVLSGNYTKLASAMTTAAQAKIGELSATADMNAARAQDIADERVQQSQADNFWSGAGKFALAAFFGPIGTALAATEVFGKKTVTNTFNREHDVKGEERDAIAGLSDELEALGFKINAWGEIAEKSAGSGDSAGLLKLLKENESLTKYTSDQSSYTAQLIGQLSGYGYDTVLSAQQQQRDLSLQKELLNNPDIDLFGMRTTKADVREVAKIIKETTAATEQERAKLADYLSTFDNYQEAAAEYAALNEFAAGAAQRQIDLGVTVGNKDEIAQQIMDDLLEDDTIEVEAIVKIDPTDVIFDEESGKYKVDEAARKFAEDQLKHERAIQRQTLLDENKDIMTADTIGRADYTTLWESGLFETEEQLQEFISQSAETRARLWDTMYDEAVDAELSAFEASVADAEERLPELTERVNNWYDQLLAKRDELIAKGIIDADETLGMTGEQLYQHMINKRAEASGIVTAKQGVLDEYTAAKEGDDDARKRFARKYLGQDNWDANKAEKYAQQVQTEINANETLVTNLNEQLAEGERLMANLATTQQVVTDNTTNAGRDAYGKWTTAVEEATEASEAFSESIGNQGSITADTLAKLAKYDSEVYNKYTQMTAADWNAYAYQKTMEHYDQLAVLYQNDAAKLIEIQQQKKEATQAYYEKVKTLAKEAADAEIDAIEEQVEKITTAYDNLTKPDLGTFSGIQKLKQSLIEVGYAAEEADRLIKNIGKEEDVEKTAEELWAVANAQIALLLDKQNKNDEKAEAAKYIVDEEHTNFVYLKDDEAGLIDLQNGSGTYEIKQKTDGLYLVKPGTNELVPLTKASNENSDANYTIYFDKDGAYYYVDDAGKLHDLTAASVSKQGYTIYANPTGTGFVYIDPTTRQVKDLVAAKESKSGYTIFANPSGTGFVYLTPGSTKLKNLRSAGVTSSGYTIYADPDPSSSGFVYLDGEGKLQALTAAGATTNGYTIYATKDTEKDGWVYITTTGDVVSLKPVGTTSAGYNVTADASGALWIFEPDGNGGYKLKQLTSEDPDAQQIIEKLKVDNPDNDFTLVGNVWTLNLDTSDVTKHMKVIVSYDDIKEAVAANNAKWTNVSDKKHTYLEGTGFHDLEGGIGSLNAIGDFLGYEGKYGAHDTHWLEDVMNNWQGDVVGWLQANDKIESSNTRARVAYTAGAQALADEIIGVDSAISDGSSFGSMIGYSNKLDRGKRTFEMDSYMTGMEDIFAKIFSDFGIEMDANLGSWIEMAREYMVTDTQSLFDWYTENVHLATNQYGSSVYRFTEPGMLTHREGSSDKFEGLIPITAEELYDSDAMKTMLGMISSWIAADLDLNSLFKDATQKFDFMKVLSKMFSVKDGKLAEGYDEIAYYCMQGFIKGLTGQEPIVQELLTQFGVDSLETLRAVFGIASPSKYTREMGKYLVEGLEEGLNETEIDFGAFGKRVLQGIKDSILAANNGEPITMEDMWDLMVPQDPENPKQITTQDKVEFLKTRNVDVIEVQNGDSVGYQVVDALDHSRVLMNDIYDSADAAADAAGEAIYAEDEVIKYINGGYWSDASLTNMQKAIYETLIDKTLKKLGKGDTFEEYLQNGGTVTEFMAEWSKQYSAYLGDFENESEATWANILDIIENVIDTQDQKDQAVAKNMLTRWQNIYKGIAAARKAAFSDEDATYGGSMSKEQRDAILTEKFSGKEQFTGQDALAWLTSKVDVNSADMQYRSYSSKDLRSLGTAYTGFSHAESGAPVITNAFDYYTHLRTSEINRNKDVLLAHNSALGTSEAGGISVALEALLNSTEPIKTEDLVAIIQAKFPNMSETDAKSLAMSAFGIKDQIDADETGGLRHKFVDLEDDENLTEATADYLATTIVDKDSAWDQGVAAELLQYVSGTLTKPLSERAQQIVDQYAGDAVAAIEDFYQYLMDAAADIKAEYDARTEQRKSETDIAKKVAGGEYLIASEQREWDAIQKKYGSQNATEAIIDIAQAQGADEAMTNWQTNQLNQGITVTQGENGSYDVTNLISGEQQHYESLAQLQEAYGLLTEQSTYLEEAEAALASALGVTDEAFAEERDSLLAASGDTRSYNQLTSQEKTQLLELTATVLRINNAWDALVDNGKDWISTLSKTKKGTKDYDNALKSLTKNTKTFFGNSTKISEDFVESHTEDIEKMLEGDEEALERLQDDIIDLELSDATASIKVDVEGADNVRDAIDNFEDMFKDLDDGAIVTPTMDTSGATQALVDLMNQGGETAEQIEAALAAVGWEPQIEMEEVPLESYDQGDGTARVPKIQFVEGIPTFAGYESVPITAEMREAGTIQIPKLNSSGKGTITGLKKTGAGQSSGKNTSSGSGGGGGGGSAKKVESYKKGSDEKERYHEITKALDKQAKELEKIDKLKSRAFGANKLAAIQKEIDALEKENKLYAEQEKQAAVNMEANKKILEGYGATFNDDGTINYEEYMDKILADYNKAVDEYNNSDQGAGAELALKKAEEIYNEAKKAMEDYEEDMDKLAESQQQQLETQNKISAAMLEGIQYKVEVQWDFNDRDVKYLQYLRDKWEETLDKADESMQAMVDEAAKYEDNLKSLQQEQNELDAAFAAGTLNEADYATGLQDINDRSLEMLNNLNTIKKSIKEAYGNALSKASEELEKHTSILEHSRSVMEQYIGLQQLMGLGADYSGLKKMYQMQFDSSNQSLDAAKKYLDTLKASKARIEEQVAEHGWTDVLKQQWEDVNAAIIEGEDDLLSKTNQALTDAQSKFVNTMNAIVDTFDEKLFGMKGSLADLEDDYAYYQEQQARYLSTSKELYEVAKLSRQIDQSIADSTTKTSKERLKALKAEIEAQSEKTRLTEYDVQMMELQYKHALALQELEEAKNAKSVVRLTRDENGNFGYQYTADDQNINDAAQKVDDTLQQINELAANRVSEMEQAAVQAERQYRDALLEIAQDTTLTLEERQAKMEELTRRYAETMQYNQEQYNNASSALLTNQQYVYERYGTSIMTNTGMIQDQMNSSVAAMMNKTTDYATFLQEQMSKGGAIYEALQQYKSDIELVNTTSGLGGWTGMTATVEDFEKANEAANEAIKTTMETISSTMENISDVTEAWEDHASVLEQVIADYEKLATDSADALRKLAGNVAGTGLAGTEGSATEDPEADSEQWMYTWGAGGFSGTWSGYDSEKAAKKGAKADIRQKIMSTLEAGETDEETAANRAKLQAIVEKADATIKIEKYKRGGLIDYTGPAWVDGSLSDPELMLNSTDTRNLLKAVNFIREIDMETLEGLYEAINESTLGMMYNMGNIQAAYGLAGAEELQQNVSITAEFPNATDRNEIAGAFEDIINLAAQYASRKK